MTVINIGGFYINVLILFALGVAASAIEESQVLKDFADGSVQYISDLYKEIIKVNSANFAVCPLSVQTVFALVNGGARGHTAKQITKSLRLPEDPEVVKETFLSLDESLQTNDKYNLSTANTIYIKDDFYISSSYKNFAKDVFQTKVQNISFKKLAEAVVEINRWVEEETDGKLKNLVNEDSLDPGTVALLINAMYFQGKWVNQFSWVKKARFYLDRYKSIDTNMMSVTAQVNYYYSSELRVKFVELPYEGDDITMTIVLPNDLDGLSALEGCIGEVLLAPKFESKQVLVYLPKFKIETTIDFVPILQALGITDAFSEAADFRGISDYPGHLSISDVIQKVLIQVDEKGTTAAAATSVTIVNRIASRDDPKILSFVADHPFLFYLKHKVIGVLFTGRFSVPE